MNPSIAHQSSPLKNANKIIHEELDAIAVQAALELAAQRIAPTWPLDRFIAVNPLWPQIASPLPEVSAKMAALSGARFLMPRAWYAAEWRAGRLAASHLQRSIERAGAAVTVDALVALMAQPANAITPRQKVIDVVDAQRLSPHAMPWQEFVQHNTSQFCASYFDEGQASLRPSRVGGLYASWRRNALIDRAPATLMGLADFRQRVAALPQSHIELAVLALAELEVAPEAWNDYLGSLLADVNGWASWCAYLRWTARLEGGDDGHIVGLLALRLAWEWLLLSAGGPELRERWRSAMSAWPLADSAARAAQAHDWLLQDGVEIAWQDGVCHALAANMAAPVERAAPSVQAAFCIDVRSEVIRRALEGVSDDIQTLGFAGFFGAPIDYCPVGATEARPQLPALLAPRMRARDVGVPTAIATARASRLASKKSWKLFKNGPLSSFSFVESLGVAAFAKLLGESFGRGPRAAQQHERAGLSAAEHALRNPRIVAHADGSALTVAQRCDLAAGILRGLSLTHGFAPLVLLMGHGSETRNNPHAAGLDCGACCGQTGEVNARAVAAVFNDPEVRAGLRERGIDIPESTRFMGGLHNTTTDELRLFELANLPTAAQSAVAALQGKLASAGAVARAERAAALGLGNVSTAQRDAAITARARDWSEVRPEPSGRLRR